MRSFTIMNIPEPLHPAIVHFPIVLILLGAITAIAAAASPRDVLSRISAIVWFLAVVGALAATWSGDKEEDKAELADPKAEQILEEHEKWGERSRNAAIFAALAAGTAVALLKRSPRLSRGAAAITAVISLAASWSVIQAGHYGGLLVYRHGVGVSRNVPTDVAMQRITARRFHWTMIDLWTVDVRPTIRVTRISHVRLLPAHLEEASRSNPPLPFAIPAMVRPGRLPLLFGATRARAVCGGNHIFNATQPPRKEWNFSTGPGTWQDQPCESSWPKMTRACADSLWRPSGTVVTRLKTPATE